MKRRFFFCEVPVRYYPVALFVFFALLSGEPSFAYAISMGVGYFFGQGKLDHVLKLSSGKAKEWETGVLSSLTSRQGWVYGHDALGNDAWSQVAVSGMGPMVSLKYSKYARVDRYAVYCDSHRFLPAGIFHVSTDTRFGRWRSFDRSCFSVGGVRDCPR